MSAPRDENTDEPIKPSWFPDAPTLPECTEVGCPCKTVMSFPCTCGEDLRELHEEICRLRQHNAHLEKRLTDAGIIKVVTENTRLRSRLQLVESELSFNEGITVPELQEAVKRLSQNKESLGNAVVRLTEERDAAKALLRRYRAHADNDDQLEGVDADTDAYFSEKKRCSVRAE